jgi:hypothetical protein
VVDRRRDVQPGGGEDGHGAVGLGWGQHGQAVPRQAGPVEVLLHGERGAQQADRGQAGLPDRVGGDVGDVQQRDLDRGLHLVGDPVHGVGA